MHETSRDWVRRCLVERDLKPEAVCEIGSLDVNGNLRDLFNGAMYVGVNDCPGPNVDIVMQAQDYDGNQQFDVVVCTSVLEHVGDRKGIVDSMFRACKPGGWLIITTVGDPFPVHGQHGSPGLAPGEFYKNVTPEEFSKLLDDPRAEGFHTECYDQGDIFGIVRVK